MNRQRFDYMILFVIAIVVFSCVACNQNSNVNDESVKTNFMSEIAYNALDSVLKDVGADSGLVVVMDSQKKTIIAKVSSHRSGNDIIHKPYESECFPMIMRSIVYYTALQIDGIDDNMIFDTGYGIYESELPQSKAEKEVIRDHNWRRGGYGQLSMQRGFEVGSDIATTKTVELAMQNNGRVFVDLLKQQNIQLEEHDVSFFNLMNKKLTPEEQVKWLNFIAIGGDSNTTEKSQEAIRRHQIALRLSVSQGLSKKADSKWVDVSGKTFRWQSDEDRMPIQYILGFYGFFPSDNPMCTIYVELSKPGLPASGAMAAYVFTSIIDQLYSANLESLKDVTE